VFSDVFDDGFVWNGSCFDGVFEESSEEKPSGAGRPAVESEYELVQIGLEMLMRHGSLMSSTKPAFEKGNNPVRQLEVFGRWLMLEGIRPGITRPAVSPEAASRHDVPPCKTNEAFAGRIVDSFHPYAPKTRISLVLDGNCDENFPVRTTPRLSGSIAANVGLINLDHSGKKLPAMKHHRPPELVEDAPCSLVAPEPKLCMKAFRAVPVLLPDHPPCGEEPGAEGYFGVLKYRARPDMRSLVTDCAHHAATCLPSFLSTALRTAKTIRPSKACEIVGTCLLGVEGTLKFDEVSGVAIHAGTLPAVGTAVKEIPQL